MDSVKAKDLEFLRRIRGRFKDSSLREGALMGAAICFLLSPGLILAVLFSQSHIKWNGDDIACVIVSILGLVMAIFFWRCTGVEYEFTGEEIIQMRKGKPLKRAVISDITGINVNYRERSMLIETSRCKMSVVIYGSLDKAIQVEASKSLAPEELESSLGVGKQMRKLNNIWSIATWVFIGIVAMAALFVFSLFAKSAKPLPDALQAELIHATNFEALALNHVSVVELKSEGVSISTNQLMDYVVLGGVQITNMNLRLKLVGALCKDISYPAHAATCFEPRHGIRCIDGTNQIMMAICYHCGDVYLEWNGTNMDCLVKTARQSPASQQIFEQIFHDAGVKEDEN